MSAPGTTEGSPDALRAAAPGFDHAGEHLQTAHDTLRGVEDRLGPCWGDDDAGTKFGEGYLKGVTSVDDVVAKIVAALANTTGGLEKAADALAEAEQANVDVLNTVAEEV